MMALGLKCKSWTDEARIVQWMSFPSKRLEGRDLLRFDPSGLVVFVHVAIYSSIT